jgi:hypothetical protein
MPPEWHFTKCRIGSHCLRGSDENAAIRRCQYLDGILEPTARVFSDLH